MTCENCMYDNPTQKDKHVDNMIIIHVGTYWGQEIKEFNYLGTNLW